MLHLFNIDAELDSIVAEEGRSYQLLRATDWEIDILPVNKEAPFEIFNIPTQDTILVYSA